MFYARYDLTEFETIVGLRRKWYPVVLDCDGMVSIPVIPVDSPKHEVATNRAFAALP